MDKLEYIVNRSTEQLKAAENAGLYYVCRVECSADEMQIMVYSLTPSGTLDSCLHMKTVKKLKTQTMEQLQAYFDEAQKVINTGTDNSIEKLQKDADYLRVLYQAKMAKIAILKKGGK